jgi:small-conductance mechanosensitive channel
MNIYDFIITPTATHLIRITFITLIGLLLIGLLVRFIKRVKSPRVTDHIRFLLTRGTWYAGSSLIAIMVLSEFGFHIGTILGAAGIAGAAIGFASQTSLSNIISGLFLLTENSFSVGDIITISGITGTVVDLGLLSIKLRQEDGTCVRIPHEQAIKASLINVSYFEHRRFDFNVTIAYKENIPAVTEIIRATIKANKYTACEQEPTIFCDQLKDEGISLFVGAWTHKNNYSHVKNTLLTELKKAFETTNIELPFPQLALIMHK